MSSAEDIRTAFDNAQPYTVGIEDEVMLLHPESFELLPRSVEALALLGDDPRYKLELPAAHLEIVTQPTAGVGEAAQLLHRARSEAASRLAATARLASAGVHPTSPGRGELNSTERYRHTIEEYGPVAYRQLVCALQVHVAVGDADVALAVYNAARCYLPLLAALAANAPFYEGRDTGLASVRPTLCQLLPRQGLPPRIASWEQFADDLNWGETSGRFQPGAWWWELRPHRHYGTLEFRVPDGQSCVGGAAALAAVIQSLVAWLADRQRRGEPLPDAPTWRIAENRWSACRHGVEGQMADLGSGQLRATRRLLAELLDALAPVAEGLGCPHELAAARALMAENGALSQRRIVAERGISELPAWLAECFLASPSG
jgi:carboxylate-amine ligase